MDTEPAVQNTEEKQIESNEYKMADTANTDVNCDACLPEYNDGYQDINQMLTDGLKDDRAVEKIQQCIETLYFDEQKREQTYSKDLIRKSFGWLFQNKCKIIDAYFLYYQLPDIAMRVKELDLKNTNFCRVLTLERPKRRLSLMKMKTKKDEPEQQNEGGSNILSAFMNIKLKMDQQKS